MLTQFLFVGVGGSGAKTLRAIRAELHKTLMSSKAGRDYLGRYGFPNSWQFLSIDTPYVQDGEDFNSKALSESEYFGMVESGVPLDVLIENIKNRRIPGEYLEEVMNPLPMRGEYPKAVDQGAGQYRAIGRTVAVARLDQIRLRVKQAFANMQSGDSLAQMEALGRVFKQPAITTFRPNILLISSLAGGSGSGQFLDVSEAIKGARPSEGWVNDQSAVLFAPDVFDDPKIDIKSGLAPNSLHSIGELVNSRFRRSRTPSLESLYTAAEFQAMPDSTYNVGPKHIYLVGNSNSKVNFSSQNDVYHAVALSLAKWATDGTITEQIGHYATTNAQKSSDASMLKLDNDQVPAPINSLGFGRVSLGMDLFADYCKGRIARAAVHRLVRKHTENMEEGEKDLDAVKRHVDSLIDIFVEDLGFKESTLIERFHTSPIQRQLSDDFRRGLKSRNQNDGKSEIARATWRENILTSLKLEFPKYSQNWISTRSVEDAVLAAQQDALKTILRYTANHGLLITSGLLERVATKLRDYLSDREFTQMHRESMYEDVLGSLIKTLSGSASGGIRDENPEVVQAFANASTVAETYLQTDDKILARQLLKDSVDNFLTPLSAELKRRQDIMSTSIKNANYKQTGQNMFTTWPTKGTVPKQPPSNIRLLVKPVSFENLFEDLLSKSLNKSKFSDAIEYAIQEIICGSDSIPEMKDIDLRQIANLQRIWNPFIEIKTGKSTLTDWHPAIAFTNQSRWSGQFESDLEDWESMAERYIYIPGRQLAKELEKTLFDWLKNSDDSIRVENEDTLVDEFTAAVVHSYPFAKISTTLHPQVHNGVNLKPSISISQIPVDLDNSISNIGQRLLEVLVSNGQNDTKTQEAFVGERSNASSIEFFTTFNAPMHHFVFDNLMEPIIQQWGKVKGTPSLKDDFMQWRVGKPLAETIPASPARIDQVLRGWYVMKLLALDKNSRAPGGYDPKLEIWDVKPGQNKHVSFPYPLYFPGERIGIVEWPAAMLASLGIALAECTNVASLTPLRPYHVLMELGGNPPTQYEPMPTAGTALSDWVRIGAYSDSPISPIPKVDNAGEKSMSVDERKARVKSFFEHQKESFLKEIVDTGDGNVHPQLVWQIRREVIGALDTLISMTDRIDKEV